MRSNLRADEAGVTPVIGTVLILGITVTGMALVLFMGTPVLERLQDDAALRTVAGQFEVVRHNVATLSIPETAKSAGLAPSGGNMALSRGDAMMVTVNMDDTAPTRSSCDFRVQGWSTFTDEVQISYLPVPPQCRTIVEAGPLDCDDPLLGIAIDQVCVEVHRVDGNTFVDLDASCNACTNLLETWTLSEALERTSEYRFRLTHPDCNGGVCAEAWLIPTDRLHWTRASGAGGVEATFEFGAVFLSSRNQEYISADPFITERSTDASPAPYLLRIPDLEATSSSVISGSDNHEILIQVSATYVRVQTETATRLRYDIAGPLADAWCQSFLMRNNLNAPPGAYSSSAASDPANTGHHCAVGSAALDSADPTYTVLYTPTGVTYFPFELSHAALTASLQL